MTTSSRRAAQSRQERRRWRRKQGQRQRPRQHAPMPPHFGVGDQVELEEVVEQRARKLSACAEVGNTAAAHGNAAAPAEQHAQGRTRECPTGSPLVSSGGDVTWIFGIRNRVLMHGRQRWQRRPNSGQCDNEPHERRKRAQTRGCLCVPPARRHLLQTVSFVVRCVRPCPCDRYELPSLRSGQLRLTVT